MLETSPAFAFNELRVFLPGNVAPWRSLRSFILAALRSPFRHPCIKTTLKRGSKLSHDASRFGNETVRKCLWFSGLEAGNDE